MEISFNFRADCAEEYSAPQRITAPEERASQWLIAEIFADLSDELTRRQQARRQD